MALGSPKLTYLYTDDAGKAWTVKLASDDVVTNSGLTIFSPVGPQPTPIQGRISAKRCRRVYAQGEVPPVTGTQNRIIRRAFICNVTGSLYALNAPQTVSYAGVVGGSLSTTGRRGERFTF